MRWLPWMLLTLGCGADSRSTVAVEQAYTEMASTIALFQVAAEGLHDATTELCTDTTEADITAARAAWWTARGAYKQVSMAGFGPLEELPERLGPKLDFWPARPDAIDTLIASDASLDADAFATLGAATRGLPAIEVVLYNDDPLTAWASEPRRCAFVAGASADVANSAALLVTAWASWEQRLTAPDGDPYASTQEVLNEWVNRAAFAAEDIRLEKLGNPMGSGPDDVRPDAIESPYAHRSIADAIDTLDGAHRILMAVLDAADEPELASRADDAHQHARDALSDVAEPLADTLVIEPEIAQRAQDAVQAYQVLVQVDIAQALSVTVVFNDNDGD